MIIHVVPWAGSNRGGVEVSVSQLASWQREAGLDVEILTFEDAGRRRSVSTDLLGVPVVQQRWYGWDVSEKGLKGRLSTWWHRRLLKDLLQSKSCEVIHFHYLDPAYTTAVEVCKELCIPYTITFHGCDTFEFARDWNRYRTIVQQAADVRAVSADTGSLVKKVITERADFPVPRISVVRQGIRLSDADARPRGERSGIIFVGSLSHRKNPLLFCEAMDLVRRKHPGCAAIIVGTGELGGKLQVAYPWVDFRGQFSSEEVSRHIGQARALCITSRSEGLPRVAIEAHGLGTPVVSTRVDGIPEIVVDGETGFLHIDPSPTDLCLSLCKLLEDDQGWESMSEKARMRVAALHSPEQFVRAYAAPETLAHLDAVTGSI